MSGARLPGLLLALLVLHLFLIQPNHPEALHLAVLAFVPLETPAIVIALALLPARGLATGAIRLALVAALVTIALLKLGDYGTFLAYQRPFTLALDHHLLAAGWMLLRASVGTLQAAMGVGLVLAAIVAAAAALWWATGRLAALSPGPRWRAPLALCGVLALTLAVAEIGHARGYWRLPPRPIDAAAFTARVGLEHATRNAAVVRDLAAFRRAAAQDAAVDAPGQFSALGGRDLILLYVESYGRSSFDNPLYAGTHPATLLAIETRLADAGLAMRSGWLTAPTVGGQSWLSHATVASGLWIGDQGRYRALLASPRRTLLHLAQGAGLRTVAIKPAHVFAWPEGGFFGFDAIYNAGDLGYAGRPFNWATMSDQFTLAAFDRLERDRADRPPLLAQIALVSSHAPFLPVPPVLDWAEIGDGTVFNRWADTGDAPAVVWRDPERVRAEFRRAIDYSLRTVGAYAERVAPDEALLIVMGDHQPAPFIAGSDSAEVPVHVIGPPDLVARFAALGWQPGLVPDPGTPALPMDAMRDTLLRSLRGAGT